MRLFTGSSNLTEQSETSMTLRKITSLTATLTFVLTVVTSIILYIVPQGRVAYWADWRLWGLSKTQWGDIHINVGLLFLLALCLHVYYNWKPLVAYLKNRSRQIRILTPAFNVALVICMLTVAGTLLALPPFSWVLDFNAALKDAGAEKYGEPPYGHAELSSLKTFAKKIGLDPSVAQKRLEDAGFQVAGTEQTLQALAVANRSTPKALYDAMLASGEGMTDASGLPQSPPPGTGRLTLAQICSQYGLDAPTLLAALQARNITATASTPLRDIAEQHGMGPAEVYEMIRTVVSAPQ
jgi:hypothetical protein